MIACYVNTPAAATSAGIVSGGGVGVAAGGSAQNAGSSNSLRSPAESLKMLADGAVCMCPSMRARARALAGAEMR